MLEKLCSKLRESFRLLNETFADPYLGPFLFFVIVVAIIIIITLGYIALWSLEALPDYL